MKRNIGFYLGFFLLIVLAIGVGTILGIFLFLKLMSKNVTKKDLQDREQITESKKKVPTTTKPLTHSVSSTIIDEILAISNKIKKGEYDDFKRQRTLLRTFKTPCSRRFRINYLGLFWIPDEFTEDWSDTGIIGQSDYNIHQFIRNLF